MPDFFPASGILLAMGFGQGPGQANNVGSTYEALGFVGGQSYGLSIAASGFLIACTVGVFFLNKRKKKNVTYIDETSNDLLYEPIYLKENIDKKFFSKKNDFLFAHIKKKCYLCSKINIRTT